MPLHPQAQVIADLIASVNSRPIADAAPVDVRASYKLATIPPTDEMDEIREVDAGGVPCRLYRPSKSNDLGLLVYFHGGGFVIGDLDTHAGVASSLAAKSGHAVLAVDYRLAPEHKFPAAIDDALASVEWAFKNAKSLGIDPNRIAVGGDSAGGTLAALVCHSMVVPIKFQMLIYPGVDASMSYPSILENRGGPLLTLEVLKWFQKHYLRNASDISDVKASPILVSDEILKQMPPAIVISAEYDPIRDEGEAYGRRLIENGVSVTITRYIGEFHDFFKMIGALDDAELAHQQVASLLRKYLA
jgi:acetyl esterase